MLVIWLMYLSSQLTGESPQEIIERVTRWSALLYYDLPDGNLLLTRVGTRRAASGVAEGENIEQAYYRADMSERFSDYVGISMSVSPIAGFSPDTAYDSVTLATARDPEAAKCAIGSVSLSLKAP
jgi:prophage tail gpP-like protein